MSAQFQPLPPSPSDSIRILSLHPSHAASSSPITCTLKVSSLSDSIFFEALSYEWGPQPIAEEHEIYVNGWPVIVRPNLFLFLLRRRHESEITDLWIDALCINQENTLEKNEQVQKMGRIYKAAAKVTVWLGGERDDSSRAMEFIAESATPSTFLGLEYSELVAPAMISWSTRGYWSRTWVVQEFLLARDLSFMCGDNEIQWQAVKSLYSLASAMAGYLSQPTPAVTSTAADWRGILRLPAFTLISQRVQGQQYPTPLFNLLRKNKNTKCLDVRDKIYAMLSLASDCDGLKTILVDYDRPVSLLLMDILEFLDVDSHELFRYARFLAKLLGMNSLEVKKNLWAAKQKQNLRSPQISPKQTLDATGYQVGEVMFAKSIGGPFKNGILMLKHEAIFASSKISSAELDQLATKLSKLSSSHLKMAFEPLAAISGRSFPESGDDTIQSPASATFKIILVFTSMRTVKEILVGVTYGNVGVGDVIVQFPGQGTAILVGLYGHGERISEITGCAVLSQPGQSIRDVVTDETTEFYILQTEGQCASPPKLVRIRLTQEELLVML